jgi:hypothetical protein
MEGVELAETIHVLFSKFDQIVMGRGLTKLDTIGKRDLHRVKRDLEIDLYRKRDLLTFVMGRGLTKNMIPKATPTSSLASLTTRHTL